jgi:tripartite-type tricarboxylate transporter receptor subunit TctC
MRASRFILATAALASLLSVSALPVPGANVSAKAEDWPNRPIKVLTTTSPGGISDVFMRALAEKLGPKLGQPLARGPARTPRRTATPSASSMPIR